MKKRIKRREVYSLKSYLIYMKQYRLRIVLIFLVFIASNIALAIIPIFIGRLVGALAANPIQRDQAITYAWILILCSVGHDILWRTCELLYKQFILPLNYRYENILFRETIKKPYPYFVDKLSGKLASYINTITSELRSLNEAFFYNYASQVVGLIVIGGIMLSVNWQTGAIFAVGLLGMLVLGRYTVRQAGKYEQVAADVLSTKNGRIIDALTNFVNVKSFQKETAEIDFIKHEQDRTINAAHQSFKWSIVFWSAMSFFVRDFIWPATIALNVYFFLHGQITITELTIVLTTVLMFSGSIWELIWQVSQYNLRIARIEEAHEYLFGKTVIASLNESSPGNDVVKLDDFKTSLNITNLDFAYPDKQSVKVLKNINLNLKKGEKLGVVGRSGSGKTTLTKLLLGYYETNNKDIVLDNEPVDTRSIASLISYVPQDTSLFHRTVAENIAYATDRHVTHDEIIAAATQAHAHEFISQITDGYDALVGERGVKLSAGQRQRIAIARALLDNKPILILDEATSALDSESEVLVQEGLEALWQNKTVIAIAHRLSTLRHMDRIIVMDNGRIIEEGSHTQLLKKKGAYAKLWSHQSGGFIEE